MNNNTDVLNERIETISRANTLLTLQNEQLNERVRMMLEDIDVLNSIIKEARDDKSSRTNCSA